MTPWSWITVQGGDGFYNRIDPTDPTIVYAESQDGNLSRRDLKTSESKSIRPREDSDKDPRYRFQWNSPMAISPHDPKTIYFGGNYLFRSHDRGDTWERLGKDLTTGQDRAEIPVMGKKLDRGATLSFDDGVAAWPCITAIAESYVKAGVLWVGTDDGNVQMTQDSGKTWINVVSHIPGVPKGAYVSRIEPSHFAPGTAYITFDNHRSADYNIYIYRTTNFGDSFSRIVSGIPPEAGTVHALREDPVNQNLLFAGTEFGLFVTFDRGEAWHRVKNGLPTVPVFDLQIHPRDHDLILATHGRSFWIMDDISPLENMTPQTLSFRSEDCGHASRHSVEDGGLPQLSGHQQLPRAQRTRRIDSGLLRQERGPGAGHHRRCERRARTDTQCTRRSGRGQPSHMGYAL